MLNVIFIALGLSGLFYAAHLCGLPVAAFLKKALKPSIVFGLLLYLAATAIFGMIAASIGLEVFSSSMRVEMLPLYFWQLRNNSEAMTWLAQGVGGAAVILGLFALLLMRKPVKLHGSARWANRADVQKAGLFAEDGILVGRGFGKDLRLGGTEHVLVEAPTRAGKGVGIVIPNLLDWTGSTVVLDVKQENYDRTAGYRQGPLGQRVFLIDPLNAEGKTARYNPLAYIDRRNPADVIHELQKVGMMLYPEPVHGDSFWLDMARTAFIGLGAYVAAHPEKPFTIGQIYREFSGARGQKEVFGLIDKMKVARTPLSQQAESALSSYANNSDNTYAGIRSTVLSKINLWVNPHVDAATSDSDFALEELREGSVGPDGRRVPISLYLGVSPNDIETIQPLYNLIVQQIIDRNVRELYDEARMFKVLVLLDEFARLGQATILAQSFSYVAGYGLRLLPVVQSRSQLRAIYGPDIAKEIITNCGVEVIFGVKEDDICTELERRIGYYTFKAESRSRRLTGGGGSSVSRSDQRRALMMAQEVRDLDPAKALLFRASTPAILARKVRYFEDDRYQKRLLPPPAIKARPAPPAPQPAPLPQPAPTVPAPEPTVPVSAKSSREPSGRSGAFNV